MPLKRGIISRACSVRKGMNENQIVVYQPNETVRLDVRLENETVWLTQEQMSLLFGRDQSVIARHVGNIFKEGELDRNSVYAKNAYTASDGKTYQVAFYNLDVATLDILAKRGRSVKIELVTHSNGELEESDFEAFAKQCGKFTKTICGICHDRFIIVDGKEVFWTGASLKDAGRLTFAVAKMGAEIIPGLLASIRKATSERREYAKPPKSHGD